MKTSNKYNLPLPLYRAMEMGDYKSEPDRISITNLINPPLIRYLTDEYWEEIEEDVSDRLWALLGKSIHLVLEKYGYLVDEKKELKLGEEIQGYNYLTKKERRLKSKKEKTEKRPSIEIEKKFEIQNGKWTIVGIADLVDNEVFSIEDYKVTSVWSFLLGEKIEWERQLNCYAYLARESGYKVNKLFINAILRDWQVRKSNEKDYPEIPFLRREIRLWKPEEQKRYIQERLSLFEKAPKQCSDEEKWKHGGNFALMQRGRKKALKIFNNQEDFAHINLMQGQYIEERPAEFTRCKDYCRVSKFCPYNIYREERDE